MLTLTVPVVDPLCVVQEGQSRSKDQIDGTGMSLDNRKRVRVTGKYIPPAESKAGGPCIIHTPPSITIPPNSPTVISIGPRPHRRPDQVDDPRTEEPTIEEDWTVEATPQPRVSYCETGVPRQTMEELKSILKDSPLVSIQRRVDGKPGSPYTYLQGSSIGGGGSGSSGRSGKPERQQDDGNHNRVFSTFKPHSDASRRGPDSRESTSIQPPSSMDSSSSFRADANTNKQPGFRTHTYASSSSWAETGASDTGWLSVC